MNRNLYLQHKQNATLLNKKSPPKQRDSQSHNTHIKGKFKINGITDASVHMYPISDDDL